MFTIIITAVCVALAVLVARLQRQAQAMRACLKQYAGGRVARLAPGKVEDCQGYKTTSTVCFTDISSFSSIAEKMPPARLSLLLKEILPPALKAIRDSGGEVDKIIGDALMYRHEDAEKAVEMIEAVHATLEKAASNIAGKIGCKRIEFSTGAHTGDVFICQIGSAGGFVDFTTIGDAVNTASRVQSLCKYYNVATLITSKAFNFASNPASYKLLDIVVVKGREEAIEIYAKNPWPAKWLEFEAARRLYADAKFSEAKQMFTQSGFSLWAWRCEQLEKTPPAAWRGVWKWNQK